MASITSPEHGAQQLCKRTLFAPDGGTMASRGVMDEKVDSSEKQVFGCGSIGQCPEFFNGKVKRDYFLNTIISESMPVTVQDVGYEYPG